MRRRFSALNVRLACVALIAAAGTADAQTPLGTAFIYQGQLKQSGGPLDGAADFRFTLWDAATLGNQIGSLAEASNQIVENGLFTVAVNAVDEFGNVAFSGEARWLQIAVRFPAGSGSFVTLSPRQPLTAAPHARFASTAPWSGLTGVPAGFADGTDDEGGLTLPYAGSVSSAAPALDIEQTGDGPAARFKVQPQPEPPLPQPAVEAISEIGAPALRATNTSDGPAAVFAAVDYFNPAPTLEVEHAGVGPAATFDVGPNHTTAVPAVQITNSGNGAALEAVRGHVGPPEAPVIRAINNGGGQALLATSAGGSATIEAINTGDGPGAVVSAVDYFNPAPALEVENQGVGPAATFDVGPNHTTAVPAVQITNSGNGAALEAVRGHVGPPDAPVIRAINNGGGQALLATNDGGGATIEAINSGDGPGAVVSAVDYFNPVPALQVEHAGVGPAATFDVGPNHTMAVPAVQITNGGNGAAVEAVSGQVGPPAHPTIQATNTGSGPGVYGTSASGIAGYFENTNSSNSASTLRVESNGSDYALYAANTGGGHGVYATTTNGTPGSFEITNSSNNSPALHAESNSGGPAVFAPNTGSGPAVYAASSSGNAIHGISTSGAAGYFEGNVHLTGNLTRAYTTGTSNRAAPIAYATIDGPTGMVTAGTPNVSSVWDAANQRYVITIAGEAYFSTGYITTVTPIAGAAPEALFAVTSGGSGQLRVRIMSPPSGTTGLQRPFQFITYKP